MTSRCDFVCEIEDIWNAHLHCMNGECPDDCPGKIFCDLVFLQWEDIYNYAVFGIEPPHDWIQVVRYSEGE